MHKKNYLLLLLTSILLFSSCGAAKIARLLPPHKTNLAQAANGSMEAEAKMDILGETLVNVLEESMSFTRIRCSVKHVDKFGEQNERSMDKLVKDLGGWLEGQPLADKLLLAARIANKPYAKKLVQLVPKFERKVNRKIKTYRFIGKAMKLITPKSLLGL